MADFQTIADAHIGADELSDRISVSSSLDLNPSTPGGAFVKEWEASGYSTDANTLMAAATSAMGNGSKTSQEAAKMALRTGQITAAACAVTGVGTAIAPLCGVIGGAFGAISAYTGSIFGRVNKAEAELRQVWAQADIALAESLCAIAVAATQTLGTAISVEESGWILRAALIGLGYSDTADRMWGAGTFGSSNTCSSIWWSNYPCKGQVAGGLSEDRFSWHIIETWMIKDKYGNCVDQGDYKSDLCGKASTCDERTKRMAATISDLFEGLGVVLAALINMADEIASDQERERYRQATESSSQQVAQAAVEMQRAYGEAMHQKVLKQARKDRLLESGFSNEDAEWISESLDGTTKALVLVDRYSYSPNRAASTVGFARDRGQGALKRSYELAVWWAKNWKWLTFGGLAVAGSAGAAYWHWRR